MASSLANFAVPPAPTTATQAFEMVEVRKANEDSVERARQLMAFNQISVVLTIGLAAWFYFGFIKSPLLIAGAIWQMVFFMLLGMARRQINLDSIESIGKLVMLGNWATAIVLTVIAPFSFPAGILQVLVPVIASGPVLRQRDLLGAVVIAAVLTGIIVALGVFLDETERNDAVDEGLQDVLLVVGVPIMSISVGIGVWDSHERQQQSMRRALNDNVALRRSRQRLVAVADEERRRFERDLHDGAQQQLVAVAMQLRLLRSTNGLAEELDPVVGDLEHAIVHLRELAHGIYPPLLRSRGLTEAIGAAAHRCPLSVEVDVTAGRFDPDIEAGLYFASVEALANAAKHAGPGATVEVHIQQRSDKLFGSVADTGPGFDPMGEVTGVGLRNIEDRIIALGGTFEIQTRHRAGRGTTLTFNVPVLNESEPPTPNASSLGEVTRPTE